MFNLFIAQSLEKILFSQPQQKYSRLNTAINTLFYCKFLSKVANIILFIFSESKIHMISKNQTFIHLNNLKLAVMTLWVLISSGM